MHLREGEYEKAHTDFFEAFKNYDESGSPRYVSEFSQNIQFIVVSMIYVAFTLIPMLSLTVILMFV